jgi:4-hydroxy-tetrahydrodipicolinate reductase
MTSVAVIGVTGRMGRAIVRTSAEAGDVKVVAGIASPNSNELGRDLGELAGIPSTGVRVTTELAAAFAKCDVAIDFSNASATTANVSAARMANKPIVVGTTGFSSDIDNLIDAAAKSIPVLVAPNTSVGVTLLIELVREAAKALPAAGFDIEIHEAHHRHKRDAPSGTALALGRAAAEGRGVDLGKVGVGARAGDSPRKEGEIGFSVTRGGDIVGEHTVLFAGAGEVLSLGHRATDRSIFAQGAVRAAAWLAGQPPGRYAMRDVVGYKSGG